MSRKSRITVPIEQSLAPPVMFDKSHMICIRSADGHLFLVDRNCAMVSGLLSRALRKKFCDDDFNTTSNKTTTTTPTPIGEPPITDNKICTEKYVETNIGNESYETIILDEIRRDLLELALQAMYYKYRYDGEPEKRPVEAPHSAEDRHKLAALSVLLDM